MKITLERCEVRNWIPGDAGSLARHADNRKIWLNLRDAFPHPYSIEDARKFLERVAVQDPVTYFCIAVRGEAVGSIGFGLQTDVERFSAEIGYWLSEEHWGKGIMTETLRAVTTYAIETHGLIRVYALPYDWNEASFKVLEKAGYVLEGRLRCSAFKDGKVVDQMMFAYTIEDCQERSPD